MARTQPSSIDPTWLVPLKPILVPSLITFPALMIFSRVRLGVHTLGQCIAGAGLGVSTTIVFYTIWSGYPGAQRELFGHKVVEGLAGTQVVKELDHWLHETVFKVINVVIPNV